MINMVSMNLCWRHMTGSASGGSLQKLITSPSKSLHCTVNSKLLWYLSELSPTLPTHSPVSVYPVHTCRVIYPQTQTLLRIINPRQICYNTNQCVGWLLNAGLIMGFLPPLCMCVNKHLKMYLTDQLHFGKSWLKNFPVLGFLHEERRGPRSLILT